MSQILHQQYIVIGFVFGHDCIRLRNNAQLWCDFRIKAGFTFKDSSGSEHAANHGVLSRDLTDDVFGTRSTRIGDFETANFAHESDSGTHVLGFD